LGPRALVLRPTLLSGSAFHRLQLAPAPPTSTPWRRHAGHHAQLSREHRGLPEYPHGKSRRFKRRDKGLYGGGEALKFGNIRAKSPQKTKVRRRWLPNVTRKKLHSEALGRGVRVKVRMRVLRAVDKVGGLDNYLLGSSPARIRELGMKGWSLRWRVMQTEAVRSRFGLDEGEKGAQRREMMEAFRNAVARPSAKARYDRWRKRVERPDIWRGQPFLEIKANEMLKQAFVRLRSGRFAVPAKNPVDIPWAELFPSTLLTMHREALEKRSMTRPLEFSDEARLEDGTFEEGATDFDQEQVSSDIPSVQAAVKQPGPIVESQAPTLQEFLETHPYVPESKKKKLALKTWRGKKYDDEEYVQI
jgi:large subunit ribosomal protein L28